MSNLYRVVAKTFQYFQRGGKLKLGDPICSCKASHPPATALSLSRKLTVL